MIERSDTKGGSRCLKRRRGEVKWCWGGWAQTNLFTDVQSRNTCSQLHLSSFSSNYFLINNIRNNSSCHFVTFLLLTDIRQVFHKPPVRCCVQLDTDCLWRSTVVLRYGQWHCNFLSNFYGSSVVVGLSPLNI